MLSWPQYDRAMPIEKPYTDEGDLPEFSVIETYVGRPLFDGDTMYPKTTRDYYEWHGELCYRAPDGTVDFLLGYLNGSEEIMLSFRRAGWDVYEVVHMVTTMETLVETTIDNPFAYTDDTIKTGISRMSLVASLGRERAFALACSALTAEQLADIGKRPEQTIDMPAEYFDPLYPAISCENWDW